MASLPCSSSGEALNMKEIWTGWGRRYHVGVQKKAGRFGHAGLTMPDTAALPWTTGRQLSRLAPAVTHTLPFTEPQPFSETGGTSDSGSPCLTTAFVNRPQLFHSA